MLAKMTPALAIVDDIFVDGRKFTEFIGKRNTGKTWQCIKIFKTYSSSTAVVTPYHESKHVEWSDHGFTVLPYSLGQDWLNMLQTYDTVIIDDCWICEDIIRLLREDKKFVLLYQLPQMIRMIKVQVQKDNAKFRTKEGDMKYIDRSVYTARDVMKTCPCAVGATCFVYDRGGTVIDSSSCNHSTACLDITRSGK